MIYPGNNALSADVQERLRNTFLQALELAEAGKRQEAMLGCDFISGLDPEFALARTLRERLSAAEGPIGVDDLRAALEPVPDWGTGDRLLGDDDSIGAGDIGFGDLPPLDDDFSFASLGDADAEAAGLRPQLERLFASRRLQDLHDLAVANEAAVMADPALRELMSQAQGLLEGEPFVRQFLTQAEQAAERGDQAEVGRLLDKARSLDPDHPGIARIAGGGRAFGANGELEIEDPGLSAMPSLSLADAPGGPSGDTYGGDPRISELLDEGQRSFARNDFQAAIDAWSRIFLIDIDNDEASQRIEQARRMKAELERRVEESFQGAVGHLETGAYDQALTAFRQILELSPGHLAAKEYVQQLEAGLKPAAPKRGEGASSGSSPALAGVGSGELGDLKEEILVPPEPGAERKKAAAAAAGPVIAAKKGRAARRMFYFIGIPVLLAVAAGGWYVFQNRARFFPNAQPEVAAPTPAAVDPLVRARKLREEGKAAVALAQLKRLPPQAPQYDEAQTLIAELEAELAPKPVVDTAAEEKLAQALAKGKESYDQGEYLRARDVFERLDKIQPLPPEAAAMLADARRRLEPLREQIALITGDEIERALPALWRMHEANPLDRDVRRLLIDGYFNLGVKDLQRGDPGAAADKLAEALKLAPEDAVLKRHALFAQSYADRSPDLLYRTYVKYLATR
jgi:tetratricopeptide (TPR) repeat protein